MLSPLRLTAVRRVLVIFLMAISTVVAVQRAQAVINSVQHELAIEHSHPVQELAGGDVHDDHGASLHHDDQGQGSDRSDGAPGPHHHHAEAPQVADLSTPAFDRVALSRSDADFPHAETRFPRSLVFGLERPPKASSSIRA